MSSLIKYLCCIGFLCYCFELQAQELPPIINYKPVDYNAESQNWDITQSEDKVMFFANNAGLLEFNGSTWYIYQNPNQSIMRSVLAVENRIYSGCYMDLGYWDRNAEGRMIYTSLLPKLEGKIIADEEFWNIEQLDQYILFQSLNRILIYNTQEKSFNEISSDSRIAKMFLVDEIIYFQRPGLGLFKIDQGTDVLVSDNELFKKDIIVNIFQTDDGLEVIMQNEGFYLLKDSDIYFLKSFETSNSKPSIYSAIKSVSYEYILGSVGSGLFDISNELKLNYQIDQTKGLGNNTVLKVFEDKDQNIWLGYDNGIGCININSPLRIFRDIRGDLGSVYTSAIYDNKLFLGTNQGLFFKELSTDELFTFVEGSQGQVWSLLNYDNTLFIGHNIGTFIFDKNRLQKISNVVGSWIIKSIPNNPEVLVQGNYDGIYLLHKVDDKWTLRNKLNGFNISSRFLEIYGNQIFVNHEYKGLFKITVDDALLDAIDISVDSLKKGTNSGLVTFNSQVLFANKDGVFKFNKKSKDFKIDSLLSSFYGIDDYLSGRLITTNSNEKLWNFNSNSVNYFSAGTINNELSLNKIPLPQSLRNSVSNYENVLSISDNEYLIGTHFGYVVVDLEKLDIAPEAIRINKLAAYSLSKEYTQEFSLSENVEIPYDLRNVEISFSVPEFESYLTKEFQYRLLGYYDEWSDWTTTSTKYFENLEYGAYTFEVRAKEGESIQSDVKRYSFKISRPWYLSSYMIIVYSLGGFLLSLLVHKVYTTYYRRQHEKLIIKAKTELEMKELENKQQLMKFNNDKLRQDIESKSRELATSTMNLIKKNEFLSTVKNELHKIDDKSQLKNIIRIIDNNLNSTDDWKLFEEAFNNADKGFLQKVKDKHQGLTPNDLRLCAYLRLNLASKEIAPLLNISPRSVEVKRYRLRKKMNLPHETSLANYIINL